MKKLFKLLGALVLLGTSAAFLSAQTGGPYTAQIQRALRALGLTRIGTTTTILGTPGPELAPAIGAGTGYTCGAGWDCTVAGVLNKDADGVGTVAPNPAITAVVGSTYRVLFTVAGLTVGSATYTMGGTPGPAALDANGSYEHYVTAATTGSLIITPTSTSRFTITVVSVRAMSAGDLEVEGKLTVRRGIAVTAGTTAAPSITGGDADSGFGFSAGYPSYPAMISDGVAGAISGPGGVFTVGIAALGGFATYLTGPTAATTQLGLADSATPVAQTLRAQGSRAGTDTNVAGGNLTLRAGTGTGNATGASLNLNVPLPVGTGSGTQTDTTFLGLNAGYGFQLYRTVTAAGTTGAQTINKPTGSVNFAAGASTLVVTDSRATSTSLIFLTPQTADATCNRFSATRAAGSFTITTPASCTAETAVAFWVTN